jgi:serine/threonine protein kinase
MGVVYLARDPLIDRQVALKTLRVDLDAEYASEFRERFLREAKAAGRLNHGGIVTIHDVGEDPESGLVFIAMEYIEGRDLKQLLAAEVEFRPSEAARIVADVAEALDYAHAMGVIHRDIKPANIILTQDGTAKITDFGIARLESSNLTVEGQFIGTPNFMSPEQITGKAIDGRSDIFSLGVVLFTLLTGQRPFAGETMHEVTLKVVQDPCPIPSTVAEHIPPAFNPVILKCLEKEPDKRFQSGAEMAKVLGALARSLTDREPGDAARTGVFYPDLETRMHAAAAGEELPVEPLPRRSVLRDFTSPRRPGHIPLRDAVLNRLPVPDIMTRDVNPAWVTILITLSAVLGFGTAALLTVLRDTGPFPAPSDAAIHNQHIVVRKMIEARRLFEADDLKATARVCTEILDQVPASDSARFLIGEVRTRLEEERTTAEIRERVAVLITEGRDAYRAGSYRTASDLFQEALDLDPENELAASYLDLAGDRLRRSSRSSPRRNVQRPTTATTTAAPSRPPQVKPTPGTARITVYFNSPISAGSITVTLNDVVVGNIPFDFSKKNVLGIKRKSTGVAKRVLLSPSGQQHIGVQLHDARRGLIASKDFHLNFPPGTDWTLRIDMPSPDAKPNIYLVKTSR